MAPDSASAPVLVAGAALLDDLDRPTRLLAARRSYPPALAGQWEFPGGKAEPGESARQALLRELAEELGTAARLGEEIPGPDEHGWPLAGPLALRLFTAVPAGPCRAGDSHDELRWMPLDEPEALRALPWIPADRPILEALLARLDRLRHTVEGGAGRPDPGRAEPMT